MYDEVWDKLTEEDGNVFLRPTDPLRPAAWVMKGQIAAEFDAVEDASHFQAAHRAIFEVMLT